jgi:hemolysin III
LNEPSLPQPRRRPRFRDPFPALSHWLGALLSVGALVLLMVRTAGRPWWEVAGFAVYGVTLIQLYSASALAHSINGSPEMEERLTRFDYAAIFMLIAGSYTPICIVVLPGRWGYGLLAAVWATAAFGIANVFKKNPSHLARVLTYVAMGWLGLAAAVPLLRVLPLAAVMWILAGGVIFTVGSAVFFTNRPNLWPGRFMAHDLWHCMVLAGSACHFVAILKYVVPT